MSNLNTLIKKRAALEAQIAEAQRREKRKADIVCLLQKHRLLDLTDDQILNALLPKSEQPAPTASPNINTYGSTQ